MGKLSTKTKASWLRGVMSAADQTKTIEYEFDDDAETVQIRDMERLARNIETARNNVVDKQAELIKAETLYERQIEAYTAAALQRGLPCQKS